MKYENIVKGKFISRPNRFISQAQVGGKEVTVHVKNTGRCAELLVKGATIYLEDFTDNMKSRKLPYSIIGVEKVLTGGKKLMINMDSQSPNKVVKEALESGVIKLPGMKKLTFIKPEAKIGDSRLDFYVKDEDGNEGYIEVKGVTLENDGIASFPDAPTLRGIKHLEELGRLKKEGYFSYAIFVVQMEGMKCFTPNKERHKEFAMALKKASEDGVSVLAYECKVLPDTLEITSPVKVILD